MIAKHNAIIIRNKFDQVNNFNIEKVSYPDWSIYFLFNLEYLWASKLCEGFQAGTSSQVEYECGRGTFMPSL